MTENQAQPVGSQLNDRQPDDGVVSRLFFLKITTSTLRTIRKTCLQSLAMSACTTVPHVPRVTCQNILHINRTVPIGDIDE